MTAGSHYSRRISVVLVEDKVSYRDSVQRAVDSTDDMLCVGAFSDVESLLDSDLAGFNILLLDIKLPGRSGIEALKDIKEHWPAAVVVMLTDLNTQEFLFEAVKHGALGYLFKAEEPLDMTLDRLREIDAGGAAMTPSIARMLLAHIAQLSIRFDLLTPRENEVMNLVVAGKTKAQIARELFIAEDTVAFHIRNIYSKLHIHTKGELIKIVVREQHGSGRILRPELTATKDVGEIKVGKSVDVTFTLSAAKSRHRRDFTIAIMIPNGLVLDGTNAAVGTVDSEPTLWTVPTSAYKREAQLTLTLSGARPGTHLVMAFVAHCSAAIQPNDTSTAILIR